MTTSKTNTVRLHRVLRAPPERVYRAFLDADAMVKWLPPNGFTGKVHQMDARVGGGYRMSFTNFTTGRSHSFGGEFVELVPNERIRHTDKFDDRNLAGEMQTTITLKKVFCGSFGGDAGAFGVHGFLHVHRRGYVLVERARWARADFVWDHFRASHALHTLGVGTAGVLHCVLVQIDDRAEGSAGALGRGF